VKGEVKCGSCFDDNILKMELENGEHGEEPVHKRGWECTLA